MDGFDVLTHCLHRLGVLGSSLDAVIGDDGDGGQDPNHDDHNKKFDNSEAAPIH
jgi:hypothetical protein